METSKMNTVIKTVLSSRPAVNEPQDLMARLGGIDTSPRSIDKRMEQLRQKLGPLVLDGDDRLLGDVIVVIVPKNL